MYKYSYDSLVKSYERVITNYRNLEFDIKSIETQKIKEKACVILKEEFTEEQIENLVNEKPHQVQTMIRDRTMDTVNVKIVTAANDLKEKRIFNNSF